MNAQVEELETKEVQQFKVRPQYSVTTSLLIGRLKDGQPGDEITDAELTKVCGKDTSVNGDGYPGLLSAIRYCLREEGIVWVRLRGEAKIRCCAECEKVAVSDAEAKAGRRRVKQSLRIVRTVDIDALETEAERRALRSKISHLATAALFMEPKTQKALIDRGATAVPDRKNVLALFGPNGDSAGA